MSASEPHGDEPANKETVRAVEQFLTKTFSGSTDQDVRDQVMRGFGRSIGMFILGMLDAGQSLPVALNQASVLISVMAHKREN